MSIAYLPCIAWVQHAIHSGVVLMEAHENYSKQSYRNRTRILSSNGVLNLTIPILQLTGKQVITQIQTDDNENWKHSHWKSISAAYGKSAFFLYYRHHFEPFFNGSCRVNLFEYNLGLLEVIFKILKVNTRLEPSATYQKAGQELVDLREKFKTKSKNPEAELLFQKPYMQVFADKFSFQTNLSILDLIFNVGPDAGSYLSAEW